MNISTNSWHSKLYRYLYGDCLPQSLCPYFWATLIGLVVVVPMTILYLPIFLFRHPRNFNGLFNHKFGEIFGIVFLTAEVIFLLGLLFYKFPFLKAILVLVLTAAAIVAIVFIVTLILELVDRIPSNPKPKRQRNPNILTSFIKAKYNRYCPKINWVDNTYYLVMGGQEPERSVANPMPKEPNDDKIN